MKLRGMRGQREAADVAGAAVSGVAARGAEVLCGILARVSAGHYAVLEVPRGASQKDVRNAYLRLSLLAHPDKNPGCSERAAEAFVAIRCVVYGVWCVCVCMRACVRVCVCACVRACLRVSHTRVCGGG